MPSRVSKLTYLAREAVSGTRQPPNKFLAGLNLMIVPNSTRGEVRPAGSLLRTSRPLIQNWSTFTIGEGSYLDYASVIYLLSGIFGVPTTTTPGGGTNAREHAFAFTPDGSNTRPTYTMATGYRGGTAEEVTRATLQSFNFGFSRTASPTIGGGGYARDPNFAATLGVNEKLVLTPSGTISAGTFKVVLNGGTASIVYNATNGSLASAIGALPGVGGTADVTVTGGTLPASPATIEFSGGTIANSDVALPTIDNTGLTGGTIAASEGQKGGITTIGVHAVQAPEWDIFVDDTPGAIGTTQVDAYSGAFQFNGTTNPEWVIRSSLSSFRNDILQVPDATMNLVLPNETAARALYTALIGGATKYVRYRATGPLIESGQNYLLQIDCAVQGSENLAQFGNEGGAETLPIPLTIVSDSSFASGGVSALVRNSLTSL